MQDKASRQAVQRLQPGSVRHTDMVQRAERQAEAYFTGILHARGYEYVTINIEKTHP